MPDCLRDSCLKIPEVDRLGQEIECAAVHGGADVGHVAVGRHDDGRKLFIALLELLKQRKPIEPRHVDIADDHVDALVGF